MILLLLLHICQIDNRNANSVGMSRTLLRLPTRKTKPFGTDDPVRTLDIINDRRKKTKNAPQPLVEAMRQFPV